MKRISKIYEIGTGYTPIPAQVAAATESIVEELTKAFISKKQNVEILDISTSKRASHDLPITEIKVPSVFTKSDVSLGLVHKVKRVVYSILLSLRLKEVLKKEKGQVVLHFHNQYNLFFFLKIVSSKLRSNAIIAYTNHNGLWSLPWEEVKQTLKKRYFQEIAAMKNADIVYVLNHNMQDNVIKHLGISAENVYQIGNGVNTDIYSPLDQAKIKEIKDKYKLSDKKVILQIGSIYENKGQERTVRLLAPVLGAEKDVVFAYAGGIVSEEYFEKVQNTAKDLGVEEQVIYLGAVAPGKEMNELYNIACATVFGSMYESFGLVCIESLSAGVPVIICSPTPVDFGAGCVECQTDDLQAKVQEIINSADCCSDLRTAARNNALANYSWSKIAQDYLDIMTSLVK